MLVLGRGVNQKIEIGGNVTIEVKEIRGRRVRLGIVAPDGVRILRTELKTGDSGRESTGASDG